MNIESWGAYYVFLAICTTGLAITMSGEHQARHRMTALGKLLAASAYLGAALSLGALGSIYGRILVGGMACCWFGDLLLVSRDSRPLFLAGLVAFLLGHLVYIAAFIIRGTSETAVLLAIFPMLAIAAAVALWLRPHLQESMVVPVHLYIGAIAAMVIFAAGTYQARGGWLLLAGAVLFFISDLGVARNRFVAPGFVNRAWGLPAYFTAQMLLAASVAG